ncbi:MAG: MobF family relaxase, partial [Acidimicrobiales bacterium]
MGFTKINQGGWAYFATDIAQGGEDYWAEDTAGRWLGAGAEALGLEGSVSPEAIEALIGRGVHPVGGQPLGRAYPPESERKVVAGYALAFSPPKSVSVLWALGDEQTAASVSAAQDAAVGVAMDYLDRHAAFTRRGHAGVLQADTAGLIAAAFTHRTSRAGDPQLHTHVLVANKAKAVSDGAWLSLDGRELYEVQKAAGMLYKAALRAELSRSLLLSWEPVDRNGVAEIRGVPTELSAAWSSRRDAIKAATAELVAEREAALGRSLSPNERSEAAQRATLATRPDKTDAHISTPELRARWAGEAHSLGLGLGAWGQDLSRHRSLDRHLRTEDIVERALAILGEGPATFGRAQVAEAVAAFISPYTASEALGDLERATEAVLAHPEVLGLLPPSLVDPPASVRRGDGMSPAERHGGARYATRSVLR